MSVHLWSSSLGECKGNNDKEPGKERQQTNLGVVKLHRLVSAKRASPSFDDCPALERREHTDRKFQRLSSHAPDQSACSSECFASLCNDKLLAALESYRRRAQENGRISAVNTKHMAMLDLEPVRRYDKSNASLH